jgi:hypothetical protein
MPRHFTRTISATLIAVFAILASAAALCLVPCELVPSAPAADAASADAPRHCGEAPAPVHHGSAINGIAESCAGQHAWEGPAGDRTVSRASAPASASVVIVPVAVQPGAESRALSGTALTPSFSPPLTFIPLRI